MNEFRMDDTNLDESPSTIAYVLLALCASAFDFEIEVLEQFGEQAVVITDEETSTEYFRVIVSRPMGEFLIKILDRTSDELNGDAGWE